MFLKYCSASTTPSAGEGGPCAFTTPATLNASAAHRLIDTPIAPRFMLRNFSTIRPDFQMEDGSEVRIQSGEKERGPNPMRAVTRARFIVLYVFLLAGLVPVPSAWAQLATAELNGRVTDSSGAVLPGVTVSATQTATGLVRTVVTDENGSYLLSNLPTGPYKLEVSLQGFKSYVQTGIVLQVGATPTINAVLEVGALEESITVDAAAPLVDVKSAGISNVIENARILELPLNGRNTVDLVLQVGAAVQTAAVSARGFPGEVNISVAGGLSTAVERDAARGS